MTTNGNRYVEAGPMAWEKSVSPGFLVKRLYEDAAAGESTWLMKLEPGCVYPPHAHDIFEEVFVLEGAFHDGERVLAAGDHVTREVGVMHSASTQEGAVVLVIYRPR